MRNGLVGSSDEVPKELELLGCQTHVEATYRQVAGAEIDINISLYPSNVICCDALSSARGTLRSEARIRASSSGIDQIAHFIIVTKPGIACVVSQISNSPGPGGIWGRYSDGWQSRRRVGLRKDI